MFYRDINLFLQHATLAILTPTKPAINHCYFHPHYQSQLTSPSLPPPHPPSLSHICIQSPVLTLRHPGTSSSKLSLPGKIQSQAIQSHRADSHEHITTQPLIFQPRASNTSLTTSHPSSAYTKPLPYHRNSQSSARRHCLTHHTTTADVTTFPSIIKPFQSPFITISIC